MKKTFILFSLIIFTFSYGQKKVKKSQNKSVAEKKISTSKEELEKKITTIPVQKDYDSDITLDPTSNPIYTVIGEDYDQLYNAAGIEVQPEFPGGKTALEDYLFKNFKLSDEMVESKLIGKVFVSIVVERDGSLTDIRVIKDLGYETGKEAIRIVKIMPRWNPGMQNGKKVRCTYHIPITIDATKK